MNNKKALNMKWVIVSYLIALAIQILFFVFQLANKIVSVWNVISTAMMVGIFVFAIKNHFHEKKEKERVKFDEITGGSTVNHFEQKRNKKLIVVQAIVILVCFVVSAVFFGVHDKKVDGLKLVDSTVIAQNGETIIETEETDDGIVEKEYDHVEVLIEYQFEGKSKTAIIESNTTNKIYVDSLKIYIDQNGELVSDYGRLLVWKVEAIAFLIFAVAMLVSLIFKLGIEFNAGFIMMFIGFAFLGLIGCPFIENILYNDIVCFLLMFVNVGLSILLYLLFVFIFDRNKKSDGKVDSEKTFCKSCGAKLENGYRFCGECGEKILIAEKKELGES